MQLANDLIQWLLIVLLMWQTISQRGMIEELYFESASMSAIIANASQPAGDPRRT